MNMIRSFCIMGISFLFLICASEGFSAPTYTPAPQIYMTGQSLSGGVVQARFDVAAALIASSASIVPAHLETPSKTFSGAFYLSGAGWVDITGVMLDCGGQLLSNLAPNTPCSLSGIAQSEVIGDVLFEGSSSNPKIQYLPKSGILSGSITSNIGDFSLSGIILPLKKSAFINPSASGIVNPSTHFSIKNPGLYMSSGGLWKVDFTPLSSSFPSSDSSSDGNFIVDLSLSAHYDVKITDPNGSTTVFSDFYEAKNAPLSFTLTPASFIQDICNTGLYPSYCPDGATLSSSTLSKNGSNLIADGNSYYDFTMKLRDQYGNRVTDGFLNVQYTSQVYFDQTPSGIYISHSPSISAILGRPTNIGDPSNFTVPIASIMGADVTYGFASYAPTDDTTNQILTLSGIIYTDSTNSVVDLTSSINPGLKKIEFLPLYKSSVLPPSDIIIGKETLYQIHHELPASPVSTTNLEDILLFFIGNFGNAGLDYLASNPVPACTKDAQSDPITAPQKCDWGYFPDKFSSPSVLTTTASSFSGTYIPYVIDPDLEEVTYRSYITYQIDGNTVIYPSTYGSLGNAVYDDSAVKILGQNNVGKQYGGIESGNGADIWNRIHKNVMTLSRNRANYDDMNYSILLNDQSIDNAYFTFTDATHTKKRSLIVVGHDITITGDITKNPDHPLSIIALADANNLGGNIFIAPGVKDIAASLFAEHAIQSSNPASSDKQLSILGSVVSRNTMGETLSKICPFFVTDPCTQSEAKKYDFEKIREGYTKLTSKTPPYQATLGRASTYPNTAVIIEYDGRVQTDPPVGL